MDVVALTKAYFEVWNRHDVPGIEALHAASSKLKVQRALCAVGSHARPAPNL
jgi:hypothetical protein